MRMFFAVDVNEEVRRSAARAIDPTIDVKWTTPEKMHATVKFLGSVKEEKVSEILSAAQQIVREIKPFEVHARGVGFFPSDRTPRVLWVGIEDLSQTLARIAAQLNEVLAAQGFEKETKSFHPHLTLARAKGPFRDGRKVTQWQERWKETDFGVSVISEITLYQSRTLPEGSIYKALHRIPII